MRIDCRHGYYVFEEGSSGEMAKFQELFDVELARASDHFTFADLVDAPDYSLPGGTFLGAPTTVAFEGKPWEVMRENGLVYDFLNGEVVPIESIVKTIKVKQSGRYYFTNGMILAGSVTDDGLRVTDYAAFFQSPDFRYSEVVTDG